MDVVLHPGAREELRDLGKSSVAEHRAMLHALTLLEVSGPRLPAPHSSAVKGKGLCELRPRAGRSPWRAFYRRVGNTWRVGAIGPRAKQDPRGFQSAVERALQRLDSDRWP